MRAAIAEHAVPAYVPQARGPITHDVVFSYPRERPEEEPVFDSVPCCGSMEVDAVKGAKEAAGMENIRVVRRGGVA